MNNKNEIILEYSFCKLKLWNNYLDIIIFWVSFWNEIIYSYLEYNWLKFWYVDNNECLMILMFYGGKKCLFCGFGLSLFIYRFYVYCYK